MNAHLNDSWTLEISTTEASNPEVVHPRRVFRGPAPEERRIDPETYEPLTRKEFVAEYGGTREWDEAEVDDEEYESSDAANMANRRAAERARDAAIKDFMRTHKCSAVEGEMDDEDWSLGEVDSSKDASCINCEARIDTEIDSPSNYEGQSWWTTRSRSPRARPNGQCVMKGSADRARRRKRSRRKSSPSSAATVRRPD